jgi:hypothetical protein
MGAKQGTRWSRLMVKKPYIVGLWGVSWESEKSAIGGEIGIRTLGTLTGTPHFECGAFDHSAISPLIGRIRKQPG